MQKKLKSNGAEITEGTAQIEPQFRLDRHNELFVKADTFDSLVTAINQARTLEEQVIAISDSIPCYPLDGIRAANLALSRVFGFTKAMEIKSFFGSQPPQRITIQTGVTTSESAAFGNMLPPSLEGGIIAINVNDLDPLSILISARIKRKFEPKIREVIECAKEILLNESIYRGQAVELDLSFITDGDYNPMRHNPKFLDISKEIKIILPRDVEFTVQHHILDRIEHAETLNSLGIKGKKTFLCSGKYGTGKSLLARSIAQFAAKHNRTFFYLKTPSQFCEGFKLATMYRAVFFVEDIDEVASGDRNVEMNMMLEALDGIAAKQAQVITILTTNHVEKIHAAFKRSGRIDRHIKLRPLDKENATRFLELMASDIIAPEVDLDSLGEAFQGLVPADVMEAIDEAKASAFCLHGADIAGKITEQTMRDCAEVVKNKYDEAQTESESERKLRQITQGFALLTGANGDAEQMPNGHLLGIENRLQRVETISRETRDIVSNY